MKLFVSLLLLIPSWASAADALYSANGKTFTEKELNVQSQQALFQARLEHHNRMESIAEGNLLQLHFEDIAKSKKKTVAEVEAELLSAGTPKDSELKKLYEENKSRIPPNVTYDQVKPDLIRYATQMKAVEKRKALVDQLKKSSKFKMLAQAPEAPVVSINSDGFPTKGSKGAKVKVVEFADYQCPHCGEAAKVFADLLKSYSSKIEYVFMDFPINSSGISLAVAEGAFCAQQQQKYWEYHEAAFKQQRSLTKESPKALAKELKLDSAKFDACLQSAEAKSFVQKAKSEGERVGVQGTPAIFINGQLYMGEHNLTALKKAVDQRL